MSPKWMLVLVVLQACAPRLPLENAPCPCASGWVCCESKPICVQDVAECPAPPGLVVVPADPDLGTNRRLQFAAAGATTWRVVEPDGGHVDESGLYASPAQPGTYHLVASGPGFADTVVAVRVHPLSLDVVAGQYGGRAPLPIDGVAEAARFTAPGAMTMDASFVYVVDQPLIGFRAVDGYVGSVVRRINRSTGAVDTLVHGPTQNHTGFPAALVDGPLETATFAHPTALAYDGHGHLLVADLCLVREIDLSARTVRTIVGVPTFASFAEAQACVFDDSIGGLASDGGDRLFVTRRYLHTVDEVRLSTGVVTRLAGAPNSAGSEDGVGGRLSQPRQVFFDVDSSEGERLLIADQDGHSVRALRLGVSGSLRTLFMRPSEVVACFGLAADDPGHRVAFFRSGNGMEWTGDGRFYEDTAFGRSNLSACAIEAQGEVWASNNEALLFRRRAAGMPAVVVGRGGGLPGVLDGVGTAAQLMVGRLQAASLAVTPGGVAFLLDTNNRLVRRVELATGVVTTAFRDLDTSFVAVDGDFLYAMQGRQLRRVALSGGAWEAIAGVEADLFEPTRDGVGALATFGLVRDVTFDGQGSLWFSEFSPSEQVTKLRGVRLADGAVSTLVTTFEAQAALTSDGAETLYVSTGVGLEAVSTRTGARTLVLATTTELPLSSLGDLLFDHGALLFTTSEPDLAPSFVRELYVVKQLDLATKVVATVVGDQQRPAVLPGPLAQASVHSASGLALLPSGDLLITDQDEHSLLMVR